MNKLLTGIITATIVVILCATALVPICYDASHEENSLDVIVMSGQSNAAYGGAYVNPTILNAEYPDAPKSDIFYYGSIWGPTNINDGVTDYSFQSMYADGSWKCGGYGPSLCNAIAERNHHSIYYINIGVAGSNIQGLIPGSTGGNWGLAILEDALNAIPSGYTVNLLGVCFAQGEADASTSIDAYTTDFDKVFRAYQSLGFNSMYIIETREDYGGNASIAQAQIAEHSSKVKIVCTIQNNFSEAAGTLYPGEPVHYSQKGRILIGTEVGKNIPLPGYSENIIPMLALIPLFVLIATFVGLSRIVLANRE